MLHEAALGDPDYSHKGYPKQQLMAIRWPILRKVLTVES